MNVVVLNLGFWFSSYYYYYYYYYYDSELVVLSSYPPKQVPAMVCINPTNPKFSTASFRRLSYQVTRCCDLTIAYGMGFGVLFFKQKKFMFFFPRWDGHYLVDHHTEKKDHSNTCSTREHKVQSK